MKKKIMMTGTLIIMCMGIAITTFPVFAENPGIQSKGNFVLENGEMGLYAADTDYLQSNIEDLYNELPELSNISFYGIARKSKIASQGILDYDNGTVVIDSSDFTYLADEIDRLEASYKTNTTAALNHIGTYFMPDGSVTYNPDEANVLEDSAAMLSFNKLYEGILKSQSVAHLANQQAVNSLGAPLYYADTDAMNHNSLISTTTESNGFPIFIRPADAGNLTAGAAAWVNGELIIGNGADNDAYYNQGYIDGYNQSMEGVSIAYQYHEHTGNEYECGGCYQAGRHVHTGCPSHTEGTGEYSQCGFNSGHDDGGGAACPTHGSEWTYGVSDGNGTFQNDLSRT